MHKRVVRLLRRHTANAKKPSVGCSEGFLHFFVLREGKNEKTILFLFEGGKKHLFFLFVLYCYNTKIIYCILA